ncbi:MAG: hypothetical protein GEV28_34230 [Actinophytocola sp.]|uniref:hypothetical protein n=1 Tax=Actinophytocola sp. TaxID=1872138 RepID=UPI0013211E53|nr:hypothetical protein [Actinophytocola sp.]MPZ85173.1 hypothetical protein [Actinophytocola sp.]
MTTAVDEKRWLGQGGLLNTRHHKAALMVFTIVVVAHWVEHLAQAAQIYLLGWPRPAAGGALGLAFPWLAKSEWLHYGFAVVMLVSFVALRHGFTGRSRTWWNVAMWIQVWHHFEHLLLLLQAITGANLMGKPVPTSIAQLLFARVELHLFYNAVVFVPMVVAMVYHLRPRPDEVAEMTCSCRPARVRATATANA